MNHADYMSPTARLGPKGTGSPRPFSNTLLLRPQGADLSDAPSFCGGIEGAEAGPRKGAEAPISWGGSGSRKAPLRRRFRPMSKGHMVL